MNKEKDKDDTIPEGEFLVTGSDIVRQPGFFDAMMSFQYGEREESNEGFREMKRIAQDSKLEDLFNQTKDLDGPLGGRLSGDSEILHEIEDYFRQVEFYPIIRNQIKTILEFVPSVFPENWKSPEGYDELNSQEQKAYRKIAENGMRGCPGPIIQKVIELGLDYRNKYSSNED